MSNKKQTYLSPMISVCDMNDFKLLASSDGSGIHNENPGGDNNAAKAVIDVNNYNDDNTSSENNNNSLWYDEENN